MIPLVLTQPIEEEEIPLTPMGTCGLKITTTKMTMVDKEAFDLKGAP